MGLPKIFQETYPTMLRALFSVLHPNSRFMVFSGRTQALPGIRRYEMHEDKQHSVHRHTTCESEEMSESIANRNM